MTPSRVSEVYYTLLVAFAFRVLPSYNSNLLIRISLYIVVFVDLSHRQRLSIEL
jgi:hypothetical protein